jgi:hypothetical protein
MGARRRCVIVQTRVGPVRVQAQGTITERDIRAIEEVADCLQQHREKAMSYSFSVKGATKAEVEQLVREQLAGVRQGQPVHDADCDQALDAAVAYLKILPDDDTRDYGASVSGWIYVTDGKVQQASVTVSVGVQDRTAHHPV